MKQKIKEPQSRIRVTMWHKLHGFSDVTWQRLSLLLSMLIENSMLSTYITKLQNMNSNNLTVKSKYMTKQVTEKM
jgi:hypothetical protein